MNTPLRQCRSNVHATVVVGCWWTVLVVAGLLLVGVALFSASSTSFIRWLRRLPRSARRIAAERGGLTPAGRGCCTCRSPGTITRGGVPPRVLVDTLQDVRQHAGAEVLVRVGGEEGLKWSNEFL
jgi:hypothetical protein